ncbi:centrosome-associated protein 350-like isoform X2 [Amphiura filiformis]|uniref:centrosome-associated protein 350-like isoform X2 n=1 Tax=Amphiura filiformis TaxID=82378 RepID=UPI003B20DDE0
MKSDVKVPPVSNIGRNVPQTQTYYSPGALYLKMAAELNLLESLEVSVRQLTDMERTRAVSLAQQESMSLARILQRELQLLSLRLAKRWKMPTSNSRRSSNVLLLWPTRQRGC